MDAVVPLLVSCVGVLLRWRAAMERELLWRQRNMERWIDAVLREAGEVVIVPARGRHK